MRTRLHFRGFTLIEMMTVVVILAVLTTVAAFSYKRYIRRARTLEGVSVLMDIKLKQETHFMTYSSYVTTGCTNGTSASGCVNATPQPKDDDFYPDIADPTLLPVGWGWGCSDAGINYHAAAFCQLGVTPGAPETYFQYVTVGWAPGVPAPAATFIADPTRRWWFARARTYPDGTLATTQELRLSSELVEVVEINTP